MNYDNNRASALFAAVVITASTVPTAVHSFAPLRFSTSPCHHTTTAGLDHQFRSTPPLPISRNVRPFCNPSVVGLCSGSETAEGSVAGATNSKEALLEYLSQFQDPSALDNELPCGLLASDKERDNVAQGIQTLINDNSANNASSNNKIVTQSGNIQATDILGTWNLLYTSSRSMSINKSLSGLGRSSSESAKFSGLRQIFTGSKFLGFVEFVERIGSGETALDVVVSGEWILKPETDIITGAPTTCIRCDLEKVAYGRSTNNAADWSSLGSVKLNDIIYIDQDLLIMRGNVNTDTLFVFRKDGVLDQ